MTGSHEVRGSIPLGSTKSSQALTATIVAAFRRSLVAKLWPRRAASTAARLFSSIRPDVTATWRVHATAWDVHSHVQNYKVAEAHRVFAEAQVLTIVNSFAPDEPLRQSFWRRLLSSEFSVTKRRETDLLHDRRHPKLTIP